MSTSKEQAPVLKTVYPPASLRPATKLLCSQPPPKLTLVGIELNPGPIQGQAVPKLPLTGGYISVVPPGQIGSTNNIYRMDPQDDEAFDPSIQDEKSAPNSDDSSPVRKYQLGLLPMSRHMEWHDYAKPFHPFKPVHKYKEFDPVTMQYAASLADPTNVAPPPLGFGRYENDVDQVTLSAKWTALSSTGEGFVMLNPYGWQSTNSGGGTSGTANCFCSYNASVANASTTWSTSNTRVPAVNVGTIGGATTAMRVVSAQLRVLIGEAVTSAPGVMTMLRIPGVTSASAPPTDAFTTGNVSGLGESRNFMPANGMGCGLVNFIPVDSSDFEFVSSASTGLNANLLTQLLVCAFSGFPASTRIFVEAVVNAEIIASPANTAVSTLGAPESEFLSGKTPSPDTLMAKLKESAILSYEPVFSMVEDYASLNGKLTEDSQHRPTTRSGAGQAVIKALTPILGAGWNAVKAAAIHKATSNYGSVGGAATQAAFATAEHAGKQWMQMQPEAKSNSHNRKLLTKDHNKNHIKIRGLKNGNTRDRNSGFSTGWSSGGVPPSGSSSVVGKQKKR